MKTPYPVGRDEAGAVLPEPLCADLVGGGEVADAVADVDGGRQRRTILVVEDVLFATLVWISVVLVVFLLLGSSSISS